ncbi:MAG: hypothetical protein UIM53_03465 [Acutalibacteraceae bacterium]|nr:hypothetical protein [Acutalibacteraceae bacterium]
MNVNQFVCPNLPVGRVTDVIVSGEYSYLINELNNIGVNTFTTNAFASLPYYERFHTDLQCSYYKRGTLAVCQQNIPFFSLEVENTGLHIHHTNTRLKASYPHNVQFNHVVLGQKIICNKKYTNFDIKNYCHKNNIKIIDVKQGYTKCSTAVVSENAIITADPSIYKACQINKIDVLLIESGHISLYGYDYGFIGGCCGKLSNDILAFTGVVSAHKNYFDIKNFLRNYGIYILELSNKPLLDVGSIIPIMEKL